MEILEWCAKRKISEHITKDFIEYINDHSRKLFFKSHTTYTTDLFISKLSNDQLERYWKWYVMELKNSLEMSNK